MLIFWKARLVVFAVPKTGTTALEAVLAPDADAAILNPPGLKHCTVAKYDRELRPFFEQKSKRPLEKAAIMREPVDWLGSWYRYRSRPGLRGQPNSTADVDFNGFIEAYLAQDPPAFARVGSQAVFLSGGVDHLFPYETNGRFVEFLAQRLDRRIDLPDANVSPPRQADLSVGMTERLRRERPADFALWDAVQSGATRRQRDV